MRIETINSADPKVHAKNIQDALASLIRHIREDIEIVHEPRFQALLETSAEVLTGLQTAYRDYHAGAEQAWRR